MDINLTSLIIGIVLLSFFLIPIIYHEYKKSSDKTDELFSRLADKHNVKITRQDSWNDSYAIGIDANAKNLLYLNNQGEKEKKILIDLSKVEKCSISKTDKRGTTSQKVKNTDSVKLVITFARPNKQKILEFYHRAEDGKLQKEIDLAEKWIDIIKSNL